ncbi:glycoside hydrolase family 99-like domain-containing protein [Gorillibacterium timonense]|uniref:glycoside hydrolase family 99-like domain-containing protein n=1 Tax=Gorillibacterium timonense TaxID=1689269 RepID=UPI00071DA905|nr:glycoside hydrolase family 99-like domain-containing protein [Gorillibacterium timonense]
MRNFLPVAPAAILACLIGFLLFTLPGPGAPTVQAASASKSGTTAPSSVSTVKSGVASQPDTSLKSAATQPSGSSASAPSYEIGAFYFPVWNEQMGAPFVKNAEKLYGHSRDVFGGVKDHLTSPGPWGYGPFPDREPLIGWYDDREQTVMDTHILQAASRGLDHFAFYYYWKDAGGGEKPAQSIRRFQSSAYKDLMDFYLYMIASGSWPASDWESRIVPELISFMSDPSYQRTPEGRPVIGFYGDFQSRLGGREGWSRALRVLRDEAQSAGLGNPLILVSGSSSLDADEALGADGFLPLNYAGIGLAKTGVATDYSVYPAAWRSAVSRYEGHLLIPGGLSGFDPRPWRGIGYSDSTSAETVSYTDPSPTKFRKQLEEVKRYLADHPTAGNMATFYAWNEWGEGGAIEPSTLYGFGYLNAMQEVFGLSGADYAARVSREGLSTLDPTLRLEAAPDTAVVTEGQIFSFTVRATNRGSATLSGIGLKPDAAGWTVQAAGTSSADTPFSLAPGETKIFTYSVKAGVGTDYAKHPLTVWVDYSTGGKTASRTESTFVVKSPAVTAVLKPVSGAIQSGESVPLTLSLSSRFAGTPSGTYRLEAPAGWTATGASGNYALPAGSGFRSTSQRISVTVPQGTPAGSYELRWTLKSAGGQTTTGTLQLRVGNLLQNSDFELAGGGAAEGASPYWFAVTGKETLSTVLGRDGRGSSQRIAADGSGRGIGQEWIDLLPGRRYTVEAWIKVEAGALTVAEMDVDAGFKTNLGYSLREIVTAGEWKKYTFTITPKAGAAKASLRFLTAGEGRNVAYVDDVIYRLAD